MEDNLVELFCNTSSVAISNTTFYFNKASLGAIHHLLAKLAVEKHHLQTTQVLTLVGPFTFKVEHILLKILSTS